MTSLGLYMHFMCELSARDTAAYLGRFKRPVAARTATWASAGASWAAAMKSWPLQIVDNDPLALRSSSHPTKQLDIILVVLELEYKQLEK